MVDYSKWKNIEISEDEEEIDPSIGAPSLFKWLQQTRLAREAELVKQREIIERKKQQNFMEQEALRARLKNANDDSAVVEGGSSGSGGKGRVGSQEAQLKMELARLENEYCLLDNTENNMVEHQKPLAMNMDATSKLGNEAAVVNRGVTTQQANELIDAERKQELKLFIEKHEPLCKQYGMLRRYEDSMRFLQQHPVLLCEQTCRYLVLWAITLEVEQQHELVSYVAHQCTCMQYILELSFQLNLDPRGCVMTFFVKIQRCVPEYREQFVCEIERFKESIRQQAQLQIEEKRLEMIELERKARLGPGGLDPFEVFDSLPDELKVCFEKQDVDMLQTTILAMKTDVALSHIKRCIDAGIWVPCNDSLRQQTKYVNTAAVEAQKVADIVAELMEANEQKETLQVADVVTVMPKIADIMAAMTEKLIVAAETTEEPSGGELELDYQDIDIGEADEQSSVATGSDLEQTSANFKEQQLDDHSSDEDCHQPVCRRRAIIGNDHMFNTEFEQSEELNISVASMNIEHGLANPDFNQKISSIVSESIEEISETKMLVIKELDVIWTSISSMEHKSLLEHIGNRNLQLNASKIATSCGKAENNHLVSSQANLAIEEQHMRVAHEIVVEGQASMMASIIGIVEQCDNMRVSEAEPSTIEEVNVFDGLRQDLTDEDAQMKLCKILEFIDQLDESSYSDTNFAQHSTSLATTKDAKEESILLTRTDDHNDKESSNDNKTIVAGDTTTTATSAVANRNVADYRGVSINDLD